MTDEENSAASAVAAPLRASSVAAAAARLEEAARSGRPCEPVRDLIGTSDISVAYRVQQTSIDRCLSGGRLIAGRKIGLTSPAVQQQLGVGQPDFGVLLDDMQVAAGEQVQSGILIQPKAEAEIAFVLGSDLESDELDSDDHAVRFARAAIEYAVAAIEIVDSRIRDWDITITDTIADNASSGLFTLGSRQLGLDEFEPADVAMVLRQNGDAVSRGTGRACLGDPLNALVWLARAARSFGAPLRRGEIVLSGSLAAMVAVAPGDQIVAELSSLGQVSARFSVRGST
jgi:2-keto-4-pentenoate hydratase